MGNPFHYAFTTTFFGSVFLILGFMGCRLDKNPWSFVACTWSESVLWNEVRFGAGLLLAAAYCWRRALAPAPRESDKPSTR